MDIALGELGELLCVLAGGNLDNYPWLLSTNVDGLRIGRSPLLHGIVLFFISRALLLLLRGVDIGGRALYDIFCEAMDVFVVAANFAYCFVYSF